MKLKLPEPELGRRLQRERRRTSARMGIDQRLQRCLQRRDHLRGNQNGLISDDLNDMPL